MNQGVFLRLSALLVLGAIFGVLMPAAAGASESGQGLYGPVEQTGAIVDPEISEASGLAASSLDDTLFWVINDSGNPATLFAIARDGRVRAKYTIDAPNYDWEDLAAFSLDNTAYLLIADIGDNLAVRPVCNLYIVAEPKVTDTTPATVPALLPVKWRIEFRYPDGPRDCESVAVDARRKRILLLSKRDKPPVLYELPLLPASGVIQAEPVGPVTTIPPPTPEELKEPYGYTWSRPTAPAGVTPSAGVPAQSCSQISGSASRGTGIRPTW